MTPNTQLSQFAGVTHHPATNQVAGETERLRLPLKNGRTVRLIFSGSIPTQEDIKKLIALLELTKDTFPENDEGQEQIGTTN